MTSLHLILFIAFIFSAILFVFLLALFRRYLRTKAFSRLDASRAKFAPLVESVIEDPRSQDMEVLRTEYGSTDWKAVEESLLKAIEKAPAKRHERIYRFFEELGYVDYYLEKIEKGKDWEKALAAERLGLIMSRRAVPLLIKALGYRERDVHNMAVYALGLIGDAEALPAIVESFRHGIDDYEEVSLRIVKSAIIAFGGRAVEHLRPETKNPRWRIRAAAVDILGDLTDPAALKDLRDALKDPEPDVRAKAAKGLGKFKDREAVEEIAGLAGDPHWVVRLHAVRALGLIGDDASIEVIKTKLLDPHWQVRRAAAEALGEMKDSALPALTDILVNNHDRYAREQVVEELQRIGMVKSIIGDLGDEKGTVGKKGEEMLYALVMNGALSPVINAMEREGPSIRRRIIRVLERAGHAGAMEVLGRAAETDNDPEVREYAAAALEKLKA